MRADSYCTRCFWRSMSLWMQSCVHTEVKVQLRCLAEILRPLTRTSQTRTNPTPNVCSPTAYRSEATLRHKKWHKRRFNVALWNRVSLKLKRQTLRVGCESNAVGEGGVCFVWGAACPPNEGRTVLCSQQAAHHQSAYIGELENAGISSRNLHT